MELKMDVAQALVLWGKSRKWTLSGTEYSGLRWKDEEVEKPTEAELQVIWDINVHRFLRVYPPIPDQLDMLYHDIEDGKISAAAKNSSWFLAIKAVKDAVPKG
jgi:hypothetical protein